MPVENEMEKGETYGTEKPIPVSVEGGRRKSVAVGEAADIYGSVEQAEEYGYVERGYVFASNNSAIGRQKEIN